MVQATAGAHNRPPKIKMVLEILKVERENTMGQYTNKGLYNAYKKNNKEREANDYYATPTAEVENILYELGYDFSGASILEPCVGGGHMAEGIIAYLDTTGSNHNKLFATDIKERGYSTDRWHCQYDLDFLADNYPIDSADVIIMNPPYSILEPFLIRALEIAKDKLIVLCRMQVLEGESRYEKIFIDNPPTDIYQYVDRIQCWKNGEEPEGSSAQGYCWVIWDKNIKVDYPRLHWIRRADKK